MTYSALESSRTQGAPQELYLFTVAGVQYAYTDGDDDFSYGGVTYTALPISRSNITSSGSLDKSTITVSLTEQAPFCAMLRGYPKSSVISLVIRAGHLTDPDQQYLVTWAGRALSSKGQNGERQISCQPISSALRHIGLRRNWQYGCPHVLYGPYCRADQVRATVSVTPTGAVGNTVTVPAGWFGTLPMGKFAGGIVAWGDEVRTILRSAATTLVLGGPASFGSGTVLAVSLGCDHQLDDCRTLHKPVASDEADYGGGNVHNFGGQPYIPTKNPIGYNNF